MYAYCMYIVNTLFFTVFEYAKVCLLLTCLFYPPCLSYSCVIKFRLQNSVTLHFRQRRLDSITCTNTQVFQECNCLESRPLVIRGLDSRLFRSITQVYRVSIIIMPRCAHAQERYTVVCVCVCVCVCRVPQLLNAQV